MKERRMERTGGRGSVLWIYNAFCCWFYTVEINEVCKYSGKNSKRSCISQSSVPAASERLGEVCPLFSVKTTVFYKYLQGEIPKLLVCGHVVFRFLLLIFNHSQLCFSPLLFISPLNIFLFYFIFPNYVSVISHGTPPGLDLYTSYRLKLPVDRKEKCRAQ